MPAETPGPERSPSEAALEDLAVSAASNIPGADFVSITVHRRDDSMATVASTNPLAEQADAVQYELREGPCYSVVTDERFVLANDLASAVQFPRYGPKAVALGVGAQAAVQLFHEKERAGLNLYAFRPGAFDRSTVQVADLFANQGGALLGYAEQVEQLSEALHTRTDIGIAVGMLMERYGIDQHKAFAFLTRHSNNRNVKLRVLAKEVANGSFQSTPDKVRQSQA
jgi:ANTAR domain/GAF domain